MGNNFELKGMPNLAKKRIIRSTNFLSPKRAIFLVKGAKFLTPKQFLLHFYASIFFRYKILHFFQILRPILAKKTFILGWRIPRFPCEEFLVIKFLDSLIPHEEMPCVVIRKLEFLTF